MPWRRERLTTPVFWPGEFHGLYSPWGRKESDTTEQLSLDFTFSPHPKSPLIFVYSLYVIQSIWKIKEKSQPQLYVLGHSNVSVPLIFTSGHHLPFFLSPIFVDLIWGPGLPQMVLSSDICIIPTPGSVSLI